MFNVCLKKDRQQVSCGCQALSHSVKTCCRQSFLDMHWKLSLAKEIQIDPETHIGFIIYIPRCISPESLRKDIRIRIENILIMYIPCCTSIPLSRTNMEIDHEVHMAFFLHLTLQEFIEIIWGSKPKNHRVYGLYTLLI